jgi:hypothetical protein
MSKSTETTNDRVPRVLVRFGKHPSSVGNTHRVWETPIKRIETPIKRIETPIECGKRPSSVGNVHRACGNIHRAWGNTHRAWGNVGVHRGVAWEYRSVAWEYRSVRDSRNERTRGVGGAIGRIVGRCRG